MTALTPIVPTAAYTRETQPHLSTATRHVAPVSPVESPRAVQPVDDSRAAEMARYHAQRERPVGPPPSFDINVLQDIRTRIADPDMKQAIEDANARQDESAETENEGVDRSERSSADDGPRGMSEREVERREPVDVSATAMLLGSESEPAHALDKKV